MALLLSIILCFQPDQFNLTRSPRQVRAILGGVRAVFSPQGHSQAGIVRGRVQNGTRRTDSQICVIFQRDVCFGALGIEPKTLCLLGKCSTTELHLQPVCSVLQKDTYSCCFSKLAFILRSNLYNK